MIDDILAKFNFAKVYRTMTALDWRWVSSGGVPTISELQDRARTLLEDVEKSPKEFYIVETGGFRAWKYEGSVYLDFIVATSDVEYKNKKCICDLNTLMIKGCQCDSSS